jgi:hypothetical protein
MQHSSAGVVVHIIFSTEHRHPWLRSNGTSNDKKCTTAGRHSAMSSARSADGTGYSPMNNTIEMSGDRALDGA